ncbi:hypothetical protein AB4Y42_02175 [Paraburkholderia sp. EG286B]|uniref:glycan biosynthesis hexose transferase WsfD n=1 Tax=Paraburkholderia sp. EG286B TaxID=3237011 RepID=UPI0034D30543
MASAQSRTRAATARLYQVVIAFLLIFTIAKMVSIVGASPIIGYPNNYDFLRVESCMGLWPDTGEHKMDPHWAGPVNNLVLDRDYHPDLCLVSIDDLFPYLATKLYTHGEHVDYRLIGSLRILAALAAVAMLMLVAETWLQRLVVAALFTTAFGDFAYLGFFNTLYNEPTVMLGAFICAVSFWLMWTRRARPDGLSLWMSLAGVVVLGLSKQQYVPLASAFALAFCALFAWRWRSRAAVTFAVLAAACPIAFAAMNPSDEGLLSHGIRLANTMDTFLGEVLPFAHDPHRAVATLHLPDECVRGIGGNFYTPGFTQDYPCPGIFNESRVHLLPLFATQPETFFGPMKDGIAHARPFLPDRYYPFEDPSSANSIAYRLSSATSFSTLVNALPGPLFWLLVTGTIIAAIPAAAWMVWQLIHKRFDGSGAGALFAIGAGMVLYAIASSVFGDGSRETAKHGLIWLWGFSLAAISAVLLLAEIFRKRTASVTVTVEEYSDISQ